MLMPALAQASPIMQPSGPPAAEEGRGQETAARGAGSKGHFADRLAGNIRRAMGMPQEVRVEKSNRSRKQLSRTRCAWEYADCSHPLPRLQLVMMTAGQLTAG